MYVPQVAHNRHHGAVGDDDVRAQVLESTLSTRSTTLTPPPPCVCGSPFAHHHSPFTIHHSFLHFIFLLWPTAAAVFT